MQWPLTSADLYSVENSWERVKKGLRGRQIADTNLLIVKTINNWADQKNYIIIKHEIELFLTLYLYLRYTELFEI